MGWMDETILLEIDAE